ncbi:MAG: hypothetical protein H6R06_4365 [Proteobacteria bacterium]|jgi:hypothetical protein|nr:hypothetical protein [Pseudomonadota bacterium]
MASSPVLAVAHSTPAVATSWHCAVLLAVAALCTGCVDSYPTENVVTVSPYEMTQLQRIEALNALGAQGRNRQRWRYAIEAGCVLSVSHRPAGAGWATTSYRLDETSIETGYDKVEDSHYLELAGDSAAAPVRVLAGADRLAAQQGSLLLKLLKRDCRGERLSSAG